MADKTVAVISDGAWLANTAYSLGDTVSNDTLKIYKCITAGTSASSGGPTGTGTDITDNTAHWAYQETVGAAYTSLNAALSGESGDLVTNTCILTTHCHNFLDETLASTGSGYTVSSNYYINIEAYDNHQGVYDTNAYRISAAGANDVINIQENYTRIVGLQIYAIGVVATSYLQTGIGFTNLTGIQIKNCIIKGINTNRTSGDGYSGIYINGTSNSDILVINNIIYDFIDTDNRGVFINYAAGNFYNNTVYNCTYGFQTVTTNGIVKNCLAVDCGNGYEGTFSGSCSNNGSDIASDAPGSDSVDLSAYADTDIFNDPANDDFHLKSDSPCINVGVDLSATFTDDIDGETRPTGAGTWDIGADEYISGIISGTTCWGHSTAGDITETNIRTFTTNWTGTGSVTGSGDSEKLKISSGQYMESEIVETGEEEIELTQNVYETGDDVTLSYKTGVTVEDCNADSWHEYSVPFDSTGYVKVKASVA